MRSGVLGDVRTAAAAAMLGMLALAGAAPALAEEGEAAPAPAAAQQPAANWAVPCDGQAGAIDCRVVQTLMVKGTRQILLAVTVRRPDKAADPAMLVRLPHGLYLPAGVTLQIDEGKPEAHVVQTCDNRGCYAGLPIPKAMLAALSKGQKLSVVVQDTNKRAITMTMGLQGFADAFAKLP